MRASAGWFDIVWKVLSIELWASIFLDEAPANAASKFRGLSNSVGRRNIRRSRCISDPCCWCANARNWGSRERWRGDFGRSRPVAAWCGSIARPGWALPADFDFLKASRARLPFSDPAAVGRLMRRVMTPEQADRLQHLASEATRGRILCFSRWMADFGNPIDWHRDPTNQNRWRVDAHWTKVLGHGRRVGEIKFTWEAARFPQAYVMARAAALEPLAAPYLGAALISQIQSFMESNSPGLGVHWASGQETAFRLLAWIFGLQVFSAFGLVPDSVICEVGQNFAANAAHIAGHIEYARDSVYNNHLLSEALGLYAAGRLLPGNEARRWRDLGFDLLVEQADRQIYPDGSYIQQSHTYHRVAMQIYLWATALMRANAEKPPKEWLGAMERSLDFLWAHQNPRDGRLPNYGSNDGSRPLVLGDDDGYTDFRAALQCLSIETRGERVYEPGPWDEMSAWFFGAEVMELPLRPRTRASVSFAHTGHQVLRGNNPDSFCTFRCGTIVDRFSQIDMLHVDVWWRGQNVLADGGSYLYNGPPRWHRHFAGTGSHNTVQVDGEDQMLHFRQFKMLFPTEARLLRFEDAPEWALCEGEHYGYQRVAKCISSPVRSFRERRSLGGGRHDYGGRSA